MVPETKTIGQIFEGSNQYAIPEFQRDYSWKIEQQNDFLKDLLINMGEQYFFGTIIIVKSSQSGNNHIYSLIDGQQRITTFTIFLQAIKDLIVDSRKELGTDSDKTSFDDLLVKVQTDPISGGVTKNSILINPKLNPILPVKILGIGDFQDTVQTQTLEQDSIYKSYTQLKSSLSFENITQTIDVADRNQMVHSYLTNEKTRKKYILFLTSLADQLINKSSMVVINSDNAAFAQTIFKNLNSRGIPLNSIDLIKNDMLAVLEYAGQSGVVEDTWAQILRNSSKVTKSEAGNNRNPEDFFGRYWNMQKSIGLKSAYGRKMYEHFEKNTAPTKVAYSTLLEDLHYVSTFYKLLFTVNEDSAMFGKENYFKQDANNEVLIDLKFLGFYEQERTLLMALLVARDKGLIANSRFKKVLRVAVYFRLIWQVGGGKPNRLAFFDVASRRIHRGIQEKSKSLVNDGINEYKKTLTERTNGTNPKDVSLDTFKSGFNNLTYTHDAKSTNVIVKHLLVILELSLMPEKPMNNELQHLFTMQIEHVIPLSEGEASIGNLSLISPDQEHEFDRMANESNASGNKEAIDFDKKRAFYAQSQIQTLVALSKLEKFDHMDDVIKRRDQMGDKIFNFMTLSFARL